MFRRANDGITNTQPGYQTIGRACCGQVTRPSRRFLYQSDVMLGEHARKTAIYSFWFHQRIRHGEGPMMVWQECHEILLVPLLPSESNYFEGVRGRASLVIRYRPWSIFFSEQRCSFPRLYSHDLRSMKVNFSSLPDQRSGHFERH
jgi:hypothetical protein